jgi:hypothetical protein
MKRNRQKWKHVLLDVYISSHKLKTIDMDTTMGVYTYTSH